MITRTKLVIISILLLFVFSAGCIFKSSDLKSASGDNASIKKIEPLEDVDSTAGASADSADVEENTSTEPETATPGIDCGPYWAKYKEYVDAGFSENAAVLMTHECVKTYTPTGNEVAPETLPSSGSSSDSSSGNASSSAASYGNTTDVTNYMQEHPIAKFDTLADRITTVEVKGETAVLSYSTSVTDPSAESVYLCGVLFIVYPDIAKTNVTGLNDEGKAMEKSVKVFTRKSYNFNNYETWFPEYKYTECTQDSDCADTDDCTQDFCKDGRCYNSHLVTSSCTGL